MNRPDITPSVHLRAKSVGGALLGIAMCLVPLASAQDRDRDNDRDRYRDADRMTRLAPGTVLAVRTNDSVDVDRRDNRVYRGTVDQDVRGDNGRLAIPRGSSVELVVRVARDNDLILDVDSVMVNGQRYGVRTVPNRVESRPDNSVVGAIVGAISGGQAQGRAVRVPRDTVITFRLEQGLDMGVADRGVTRDGVHYHDDYYRRDKDRQ